MIGLFVNTLYLSCDLLEVPPTYRVFLLIAADHLCESLSELPKARVLNWYPDLGRM